MNRKNRTQEQDVCPSLLSSQIQLSLPSLGPFNRAMSYYQSRVELILVASSKGKIATDTYAIEEAKRAAAGLLPTSDKKKEHEPRHEAATDEQVYDRFKKR